jgi:formylglycine-generating enzyme required for sulfatase activity
VTVDNADKPGHSVTVSAGTENITLIYANNLDSIVFPTVVNNSGTATLTKKYFMCESEVTNALFAEVYQWAYANGRFSTTVTDPNGLDSTTAKHGAQELIKLSDSGCRIGYSGVAFSVDTGYESHPVSFVSWFGAVMFCNWLTEMRDGNTDKVVYTGIDTTWEAAETVEDASQTGYRLPSTDEWEFAARYVGKNPGGRTDLVSAGINGGSSSLTAGYYWIPGNYASGADTYYNSVLDTDPANGIVDGKDANDLVSVYSYYYNGGWIATGVTGTAAVKSKASNHLGIYDMSGNLMEYCFTQGSPVTYRMIKGGTWNHTAYFLQIGYESYIPATNEASYYGFRIIRTQ